MPAWRAMVKAAMHIDDEMRSNRSTILLRYQGYLPETQAGEDANFTPAGLLVLVGISFDRSAPLRVRADFTACFHVALTRRMAARCDLSIVIIDNLGRNRAFAFTV
jgi:hypothetical protein